MKIGGYQIVDLQGTPLTAGTAATVTGTHAAIAGANGKRIVVSGLVVGGTAYNDTEAFVTLSGTTYTLTVGTLSITVTAADAVTVAD